MINSVPVFNLWLLLLIIKVISKRKNYEKENVALKTYTSTITKYLCKITVFH